MAYSRWYGEEGRRWTRGLHKRLGAVAEYNSRSDIPGCLPVQSNQHVFIEGRSRARTVVAETLSGSADLFRGVSIDHITRMVPTNRHSGQ